jgi:uncharacterized membrane protein
MAGISMKNINTKIVALVVFLAGLLLTIFSLLYTSTINGSTSGMMGGSNGTFSYSVANMILAIIGSFMMAGGIFVAMFKEDYEPLTGVVPIPIQSIQTVSRTEEVRPKEEATTAPRAETEQTAQPCNPVDDRLLVLRLLTGDERTVFRAIVDSGGEALQKDLIVKTQMSDAKVSRTLDKLVEKGVVSKTRHGMTNKVRIEIEP